MPPTYLAYADVRRLHDITIRQQGGDAGVFDDNLLRSAIAAPEQYFLYELDSPRRLTLNVMTRLAACYWYHITMNHALVDGNKRVGYMSAKAFLVVNGYTFKIPHDRAEALSIRMADRGELKREDLMMKMQPHVRVSW